MHIYRTLAATFLAMNSFSHLMNFILSIHNISSYYFSRRTQHKTLGKPFEEAFWNQFLSDEWGSKLPCYPHGYTTCAKQDPWLIQASWQRRSWAWKSFMILYAISNPAREPASVGNEQCVTVSGSLLLPSHFHLLARQLTLFAET